MRPFFYPFAVISACDAAKFLVWKDNRANPYIYYEYKTANNSNGTVIIVNNLRLYCAIGGFIVAGFSWI
jgi:hypothetical protein